MHILNHTRMRNIENPCIREKCGESAFHGAHSDAMCLSVLSAEILVNVRISGRIATRQNIVVYLSSSKVYERRAYFPI